MLSAFFWGGLAAASLLVGFALAGRGVPNRIIGLIMGVAVGALISTSAYELVPESAVSINLTATGAMIPETFEHGGKFLGPATAFGFVAAAVLSSSE